MNSRLIVQQLCVLNKSEIFDRRIIPKTELRAVHYAEAHTPFVRSFFSKQRAAQSRANTHTHVNKKRLPRAFRLALCPWNKLLVFARRSNRIMSSHQATRKNSNMLSVCALTSWTLGGSKLLGDKLECARRE
jgi:hypothetical protein